MGLEPKTNTIVGHFFVPGPGPNPSSKMQTSSTSKLRSKKKVSVMDDNSTIETSILTASLDRDSTSKILNPLTYRNSMSMKEIKPFPSFTQPNRWGKSSSPSKLAPLTQSPSHSRTSDTGAASRHFDYTQAGFYNFSPYRPNSISVNISSKRCSSPDASKNSHINRRDGSPLSSQREEFTQNPHRYLIINRTVSPTMKSKSHGGSGTFGYADFLIGGDEFDDVQSVDSNLTGDSNVYFDALSDTESTANKNKKRNSIRDTQADPSNKMEPWMLLDPVFYKEKARSQWRRDVRLGKVRRQKAVNPDRGKRVLDVYYQNNLKSMNDNDEVGSDDGKDSLDSSVSPSVLGGSNTILTSKGIRLPKDRLLLTPVETQNHFGELQWKYGGKKVNYPGRPPTSIG